MSRFTASSGRAAAVIFVAIVIITPPHHGQSAVERFERAVDEYARMRHHIETIVPALEVTSDPQQIREAVEARAAAIRAVRANARQGDIFAAGTDLAFRASIVQALAARGHDVADLFEPEEEEEEAPADTAQPFVNRSYPSALGTAMWPSVLNALPLLPEPLQYRLVGRDLILLDVDANLVADILKELLPVPSSNGRRYRSTAAHGGSS
jgi:hypothetical protein